MLWKTFDAALAWCLAAGDYDLVAELLLSQLLLRGNLSPYGTVAWGMCGRTWDSLGFLPGPSLSADSFAGLEAEVEREQYAFHHMYHTIFVAGMLCNSLLSAAQTQDAVSVPRRTACGVNLGAVDETIAKAVSFVEKALDGDTHAARKTIDLIDWTADVSRLFELAELWRPSVHNGERRLGDAVLWMAGDAFIIESARAYDLPALAAALCHAVEVGSGSPTVRAGLDFLARQSLASGAIGAGYLDLDETRSLDAAGVTAALANCLGTVRRGLARNEVNVSRR
jgi:hypothetical protein